MKPLPQESNRRVAEILRALSGFQACSLAEAGHTDMAHNMVYVEPDTEEAVRAILRMANEHRWRVYPTGRGQDSISIASLPSGGMDVILSTKRMKDVISYVPGDLVVTVQPGVPFRKLQAKLAERQQMLPLDPVCAPDATVGSIVATGVSGPRRALYGTPRDMTIGLRTVFPNGDVVRAGGKVVKNVAGYDLTKLFVGSLGTLGVFTELTFKLRPLPVYRETCVLTGSLVQVEHLRTQLMQSCLIPARAELLAGPYPQVPRSEAFAFAIDCDENELSCLQQREQLKVWASELGMGFEVYQSGASTAFWDSYDQHLQDADCVIRFTAPPTRLAAVAEEVRTGVAHRHLPALRFSLCATVGTGRIFLRPLPLATQCDIVQLCRKYAGKYGGSTVLEQAPAGLLSMVNSFPPAGPVQALFDGLKRTIDPHNIMNRGRFVGGV